MTLVAVAVLALVGCGGAGSASGSAGSSDSAGPATPSSSGAGLPAGFQRVGGEAYSIGVPTTPAFVSKPDQLRDSGARVKFWVYDPAPGDNDRGKCFVEAVEQPQYRGDFPQVSIRFYEMPAPDQRILRNEVMKPTPDGTVSAVDQEATFSGKLPSGRRIGLHQWQREYLLPGRTLVSVTVTVPEEDQAAGCRGAEIAASLRPTGRQVSSTPPTPSTGG